MTTVQAAIEGADSGLLRRLVSEEPSRALELIRWGEDGKNQVPPLHYVCDMVFQGRVDQDQADAMAEVLLDAGVDPNQSYTKSGDTYLITAASLHAEAVGLRLLAAGADPHARGLFRATALHWSATCGLLKLATALVGAGADLTLADATHGSTPLEWARHRKQTSDKPVPGIDEVIDYLERTTEVHP